MQAVCYPQKSGFNYKEKLKEKTKSIPKGLGRGQLCAFIGCNYAQK